MCPLWPLHWVLLYLGVLVPLWVASCRAAEAAASWTGGFAPGEVVLLEGGPGAEVAFRTGDLTPEEALGGVLRALPRDPRVASVLPARILLRADPPEGGSWSSSFNITGHFLGYTDVRLRIETSDDKLGTKYRESDPLRVKVLRKPALLDKLFTISVIILVSIIFINFGCALDVGLLKRALVRPVGPAIGLLCHFLLLPLISYGLGLVLFPDSVPMRLGLFFTGTSPAGGASNIWTATLGGNLSLSITMTAISTLASLIMIPVWVLTLGQAIFSGGSIAIPYTRIITSAVGLFLPLSVGYLIQIYCKRLADFMVRILKPFSVLLIIFIVVFATITNLYLFKLFTWQIVASGLLLPLLGYLLGWLLGSLMRQPGEDLLAISIETGVQNTGIAIFLLRVCLEQPAADLTTVAPVSVAVMTPIPVVILYIIKRFMGDTKTIKVPVEDVENVINPSSTLSSLANNNKS